MGGVVHEIGNGKKRITKNGGLLGFILTWRGRGSCSPKRVINKARRLIEYTALHAAVCGRLWLQLRLYVRRIIFVRVGLCACRRPRTKPNKNTKTRKFLRFFFYLSREPKKVPEITGCHSILGLPVGFGCSFQLANKLARLRPHCVA